MTVIRLNTTGAQGGISPNTKTGYPNSARFLKNLDIYSDDNSIQLNLAAVKDSGSIVTDLVKWMDSGQPFDTNTYALGDTGNFYKIDSGGTWSKIATLSPVSDGTHGNGLLVFDNYVYLASDSEVARYGPLNGTPTLTNSFFESLNFNKDNANTSATGNTYTVPTSISESALLSFTPTYDPIHKVDFNINAKGTGNWTVTIHDANNVTVGSVTVANASLSTGVYTFTFASPYVHIIPSKTYHYHITSTVGDGSVVTNTSSDLSTAYFQNYFKILTYDVDFHPMHIHTNGTNGTLIIGNGQYLAEWDEANYNADKIILRPGYKARYFLMDNEYLVAYCWRGSNIDSFDDGMAFWWDGISPYYNYARPTTGGMPNAGVNFKDRVLSVLGSGGELNLGNEPYKKIAPMPQLVKGSKVEIAPGAMDVWQSQAVMGVAYNTDDGTGLVQGVYQFGSQTDRQLTYTDVATETLTLGFTISTGTLSSTSMKIGCVKALGKYLYIGWKDGSTYGVDKVSKSSGVYASTASYESLIEDKSLFANQLSSMPQKEKMALRLVITFLPLASGCSVTGKYKTERNSSWTSGTSATTGDTSTFVSFDTLGGKRYREIEYGFDATSTGSNITITSIYFEFDALENEKGVFNG